MRRTVWLVGALGLAGAAALGGMQFFGGNGGGGADSAGIPMTQADIAAGQELYQANCAACHGAQGQGQPNWQERRADGKLPAPPMNGDGHTWHHPDGQLFAMVKQGIEALAPEGYKSDMQGFDDRLSDREIRQVLAYIKSTWPSEKLARQQDITRRARGD
jgi:mono/diheme cytochrome c family protein